MEEKKLKRKPMISGIYSLLCLVVLAAALTGATYAWFTFNPVTNITPMSRTVSDGDISLLISNTGTGNFDTSCSLILNEEISQLRPVSTSDLRNFYRATAQNESGIYLLYERQTDPDGVMFHGTLYLTSIYGDADVYFNPDELSLGTNAQTNGALRLGMKITTGQGNLEYIFRLDSLETDEALGTLTVPADSTVVESIHTDGTAVFTEDPSVLIGDYFSNLQDGKATAGNKKLCLLKEDEVADVEYWLYLEGCDDNCINSVLSTDVNLRLAFAGVKAGE